MDKEKEIRQLIVAYLRGELSPDERAVLRDWTEAKESHRLLLEELADEEKRQHDIREYASFRTAEQWQELKHKMDVSPRRKFYFWKYGGVAAVLTLILAVAVVLFYRQPSPEVLQVAGPVQVVPGSAKALLIGENGLQMELGEAGENDRQVVFGADTLEVLQGNSLKYESGLGVHTGWHTLQVPKGGEFRLVMEDGTEIWLNSETKLRYPVHFPEGERRVELSGEAYFEVASDPCAPFIVCSGNLETKVLGTSFNVSAYPDENKNHTTLVEGSVEISYKGNGETVRLKPGEQALLQDGMLSVREVDTKLYTLWRMDRFTFSGESLEEVVRKLSRWYNVEFFFATTSVKQKQFTGSLPKYSDISQVLGIIEMTTDIRFEIQHNTVVIR